MPQVRSYKVRLRPSVAQAATLADFCGLYNVFLPQRIDVYRRRGLSLRYGNQAAELKACRADDPDGIGRRSFTVLQQVLRRVETTYAAFFRRRQRTLARCRRGSCRRLKVRARLAVGSARIARQRRDYAHTLARRLVTRSARIAFEHLNTAGLARWHLARSVHDASWSLLLDLTTDKTASASAVVTRGNSRSTSRTCPACGAVVAKPLSLRRHICACGCDRAVAAAQVIRDRAFGPGHGLRDISVRVAA